MNRDQALFEFLLRMGDSTLILSHRISEWCGHAPVIEKTSRWPTQRLI